MKSVFDRLESPVHNRVWVRACCWARQRSEWRSISAYCEPLDVHVPAAPVYFAVCEVNKLQGFAVRSYTQLNPAKPTRTFITLGIFDIEGASISEVASLIRIYTQRSVPLSMTVSELKRGTLGVQFVWSMPVVRTCSSTVQFGIDSKGKM